MKILVNALSAKMGGIVTYTSNLMRSFSQRGLDATFAVPPEFPAPEGSQVIHFRANRMHPVNRLIWEQTVWRRVIARQMPDILFSSANFGVLGSAVPQVLLIREGGLFDSFYLTNIAPSQGIRAALARAARRKLILTSARFADSVFVPTVALKNMVLNWAPDLESKIACNYYGTLLDHFKPKRDSRRWRQDGVLRLLYVSEYYPHKRPGMLSEAVAVLNRQGISSRLTITMDMKQIDACPGGDEDCYLVNKGVERGQVELVGKVPYADIPTLYRDHDLMLFPSVAETFGHPLIEALSIGIGIISADRPVNREVCGDGALYFSPFSITDLVDRILEMDRSEGLRQELIGKGRKRSANTFGWEHHVDALISLFEQASRQR